MTLLNKLRKKSQIRRVIEALIFVVLLVVTLIFTYLYQESRTVRLIGDFIFQYEEVEYNSNYAICAALFGISAFCAFMTFLVDIIGCRVLVTESKGDQIIITINPFGYKLYINENLNDAFIWGRTFLEGTLSDGVKMVASAQFFQSFHLTFSDNRDSIDL